MLGQTENGPTWLGRTGIAKIVEDAIHYRDQKEYDFYTYCIMSNHVHLIFKMPDQNNTRKSDTNVVTDILRSLKWFTALKANQLLQKEGAFWQAESYDHVIRGNQELKNTIFYTLNNPVKAGLVDNWRDWPYSYCKQEFLPGHR